MILYLKSHRRHPVRPAYPMPDGDLQAAVPVGWCSCCGRELYRPGRRLCADCEKSKERMFMAKQRTLSPCITCTKVPHPDQCEDKGCRQWKSWFLARWDLIHRYPRARMEQLPLVPMGVELGGKRYPAPDQLREYRQQDPCQSCLCPKDLCTGPCRIRRAWEMSKGGDI